MKMTLRWYGPGYDSVTLEQIRQIPGVTGVISTLYDVPAGEEWTFERVKELKDIVEAAGLKLEGIESVTLLNAPDAARAGAVCELRREDAFFIVGVVGEDWLVLMTRDGTVGYAPRELFWEGNG